MKIVDPKIYLPQEREHAYHPQPGNPNASQWWYNGALLENGYHFCLEWGIAGEAGAWCTFIVRDPDGKKSFLHYDYRFPDEMSAATDKMEIKTSNSSYFGKPPRYEMHVHKGNEMGADVVWENITQPVRLPPDGIYVGRLLPPTPQYMTYIVRLRSKVTGKLIVDGKEIPVKSDEGYCDHQWGNVSPMAISHSWYWALLYLPNHTIVFNEAINSAILGYTKDKWMWVYKGERPDKYLSGMDFHVEPGELFKHEGTDAMCPRKTTVYINDTEIQGTITYQLKDILLSAVDMSAWLPNLPVKQSPRYFRYLSDVHYDLNIDGEKVKGDKMEVQEFGL